jgi:hypothetical protein
MVGGWRSSVAIYQVFILVRGQPNYCVGALVKAMNEVYTAAEADKLGDCASGWGRIGIETGIGIGIGDVSFHGGSRREWFVCSRLVSVSFCSCFRKLN